MTTATEIQTTVQIIKVSDAEGNTGEAQWELKVRWPWTPQANQYGDSLWLDVKDFPEKPAIAAHNVIAVKGNIKKSKGDPHDGSKDWMWNYRILSFDGNGRPATTPETTDAVDELFPGKPDPDAPPAPGSGGARGGKGGAGVKA